MAKVTDKTINQIARIIHGAVDVRPFDQLPPHNQMLCKERAQEIADIIIADLERTKSN